MIDLTLTISPRMPVWPGDPGVAVEATRRIAQGEEANVSRYALGSHTGTHVDPPYHFEPDGVKVDALPLERLVGPAHVVDLRRVGAAIEAADLAAAAIPAVTERLLLKTRNSRLWEDSAAPFNPDYVHLGLSGARWLVDTGVRLVGIDYLSIEAFQAPGHPVHHLLLSNEIIVVEGLDLRFARAGDCQLCCLPMKIEGGDGAPARAVLL